MPSGFRSGVFKFYKIQIKYKGKFLIFIAVLFCDRFLVATLLNIDNRVMLATLIFFIFFGFRITK